MLNRCKHWMTVSPRWVGHPSALFILAIYSVAWFFVEKYNIGWDGFGQIFSLIIVIVTLASQNRDTAALNAKLDELVISVKEADSRFAGIEEKDEDEIKQVAHSTPSDSSPS